MKILVVDDNKYALDGLVRDLKELLPNDEIIEYNFSIQAKEYVNKNLDVIDIAFLDIEMPEINGIELAASIKTNNHKAKIIFVTAFTQYSLEAFKVHANGYLVKPTTKQMIKDELDAINQPYIINAKNKVRVQTFGNFEIYIDERPLKFSRSKSKELLAYLVDRKGASCTMNELAAIIFDDWSDIKKQQAYIRNIILDIKKTLVKENIEDIIIKSHNSLAVDPNKIDCDYYRFLKADPEAVNQFVGEYMSNYEWAEFTVAELYKKTNK